MIGSGEVRHGRKNFQCRKQIMTLIEFPFAVAHLLVVRLCGIMKQSITVLLFKNTSILLNIVHNTNYTQNNYATKYYVPRSSSSNGW